MTVVGWQGATEVSVRKTPRGGDGPHDETLPSGVVIWNVISLSHDPELKEKSITSPLKVSIESNAIEPLLNPQLAITEPFA